MKHSTRLFLCAGNAGYCNSLYVIQLIHASSPETMMNVTSIGILRRENGNPAAMSTRKIKKTSTAMAIPMIQRIFGINKSLS